MGPSVAEDVSQLTTVFEAIGPQLRRFLAGVTKDVHAAEDAAQASFARALEKRPTGTREELKAWFFKVAFNEALAKRRTDERFKASVRNLAWLRKEDAEGIEAGLERAEVAASVDCQVEHLPAEQRSVVRRRLTEGKTFAEIAKEDGVPLGTVLTRMRLALARLRKTLGDRS